MPNEHTQALSQPAINEVDIIQKVADLYGLQGRSRQLLYAIRRAESGRQGREFGVLNPEAMRFEKGDPVESFVTQAKWAAGTIAKRFNGDLGKFAARWAPRGVANDPTDLNRNFLRNITFFMGEQNG